MTGVDFSPRAIAIATELARELGTDARFVCADVLSLPEVLEDKFEIVYTSRGVLRWLPDLAGWAKVVAHLLVPGGTFYITEIHPVAKALVDAEGVTELRPVIHISHAPSRLLFRSKARTWTRAPTSRIPSSTFGLTAWASL